MKTKLTVVIKESKREVQQIDELIIPTTAYKLLGPIHDLIMRLDVGEDSKKPQWAKDFIKWYKNNNYTQMVGEAIHEWEKSMNDLWASGRTGQAAVIAINALDVSTIGTTSIGKLFQKMRERWIAEEEEEKQKIADQIAAELEKAEYEKSAQRTVEKQSEIIRKQQREIAKHQEERARRLLAQAEQAREALAQIAQSHGHSASQEKMYTSSLNEDKKMTKKYSSFKQQQTITENFRRFINETLSEEETAPGLMDIAPDQRAFWIFDMWIPESVEEMQRIVERRARGARFRGTTDTLPDVIRSDFTTWAYEKARDKMGSEWEGDEDGWEDAVEALGYKREELLNSDELLGKIKEILEWDDRRWVDAGLSVAPDYQTITENFRRFIGEIRVEDQLGTSTNRLTITNKEDILAAIKESYPDGISQYADVIVDFTGLNDEAIWQELDKVGLVAHLSSEIPDVTDPRIIQSEVEVWLDNRHYDAL